MPLNITVPPVRKLRDKGDFSDMNLVRQALLDVQSWAVGIEDAIADVQANYLRGKISATEPTHDGSQEDGDLWGQPV